MSTTTSSLNMAERLALASDIADWVTDAGGVIQSVSIYASKGDAYHRAIVFQIGGNEAGVDALADLLNLTEPREHSSLYERFGSVRGVSVSAYSGRSKPVCSCGQRCNHEQVPA